MFDANKNVHQIPHNLPAGEQNPPPRPPPNIQC